MCVFSPGGGGQYLSPGLKCFGAEEHSGPDPLLLPLPHEPGEESCVTETTGSCVMMRVCVYLFVLHKALD